MASNTGYDPMDDIIGTQNERRRTPSEFDEAEVNADDMFLAPSPLRDLSESPISDESHLIHQAKPKFTMPEGVDIIDLDEWEATGENNTSAETLKPRIKEEPLEVNVDDFVRTAEITSPQALPDVIVAVDKDENEIKKEDNDQWKFVWNDQIKGTIIIPDDEEDISKRPVLNADDANIVISSIATTNQNTLQKALLIKKRIRPPLTAAQNARMREIQAELAERITGKPVAGGAANIFKRQGVAPTAPVQSPSAASNDPNAWMHGDADEDERDEDPAAKFAEVKKKFNVKKRAGTFKWEDKIEFIKAQRAEKSRLKRIEAEILRAAGAGDRGGQGAEVDDDGLFVPDMPAGTSSRKRAHLATVEIEDEDEPLVGDEGPSKRRKVRGKKRSEELDLNDACMAGIEEEIAKHEKATKKKNRSSGKVATPKTASKRGPKGKGAKLSKAKPATAKTSKVKNSKSKAEKPTLFRDVTSLLSSNVYTDANANLDKQEAPVMTEKRKDDALMQLVASVPLEDQTMASRETRHILKATRILGKWKVRPDGNGKWMLQGMRSALMHFQVQGSAWMVERETGEDEPLGGMLCDSMGFGVCMVLLFVYSI